MDWLKDLIPFSLDWPWALLLLPLPLLSFLMPKKKSGSHKVSAPKLPMFEAVRSMGITQAFEEQTPQKLPIRLLFVAWCLLCLAAAKPIFIGEKIDIPLSGRDLMLAIDISPSMQETDMPLNGREATRLQVVKSVVSEFIEQRRGDRLGLILFGSQPYIQAPLSFDTVTIDTLLQEAFLGMAGDATAIGDAIALGVKRLRERPEQSRVLILMSDGANTSGEIPPEKAAQLAQQEQVKIYTVGIGADEMYRRSFFGTRKVNPSADLDEDMLTLIAQETGGQYFRARNTEELNQIYSLINALEPLEQETRSYRPTKALFYWFLAAAGIFYILALLSKNAPHLAVLSSTKNKAGKTTNA